MKSLVDANAIIQIQLYDEQHDKWEVKQMTVDEYLCTYAEMSLVIYEIPHRISCSERSPKNDEIEWSVFKTFGYSYILDDDNALAWMPLLEPYKEAEHD